GALLGEDGAVNRPDHPLRAGVVAVYASAMLHEYPDNHAERYGCWVDVTKCVASYPDPISRVFLDRLALAGRLASRPESAERFVTDLRGFLLMLSGRLVRTGPNEARAFW